MLHQLSFGVSDDHLQRIGLYSHVQVTDLAVDGLVQCAQADNRCRIFSVGQCRREREISSIADRLQCNANTIRSSLPDIELRRLAGAGNGLRLYCRNEDGAANDDKVKMNSHTAN